MFTPDLRLFLRKSSCISLLLILVFCALGSELAHASASEPSFLKDIRSAVDSGDAAKVWKLFNLEGVEKEMKGSLEKHLVKPLLAGKLIEVRAEPLPEDFRTGHVIDGVQYRPNVKPRGLIRLRYKKPGKGESTARMLYGDHGGRLMFAGTVKEKLSGKFPPSKQIQVIVIGMGHPAVTFEGHMVYLQGGKPLRDKIEDMGGGNVTRIVRGEAIQYLEVRRTSPKGSLKVIVMENEDTLFETEQLETDQPIIYKK